MTEAAGKSNFNASERHRAYLLTINDPKAKDGCSHAEIKERIMLFNPLYYAMADEIGLESKLYHTHVYFVANSGMRFSTVKSRFPQAHIDPAYGSPRQNVDYIKKEGVWAESEKKETSVDGTFEEWGELPMSAREAKDEAKAYAMERLDEGASILQIVRERPGLLNYEGHMRNMAYDMAVEKHGEVLRDVTVTFIYGKTNVGKTSFVFNQFGYSHVFHMYNYHQKNAIWDGYDPIKHDTVLMDEFLGSRSMGLTELNIVLAPFPVTNAIARYQNKVLTAKRIFIVSNISWFDLFSFERAFDSAIFNAFARRVHNIWEMRRENDSDILEIIQHKQTKDIPDLKLNEKIKIINPNTEETFDDIPF